MIRNRTKQIKVGNVKIGGNSPVSVQSMTNVDPHNANQIIEQIKMLSFSGCDIVRIAIPDIYAAKLIPKIKKNVNIPIIADIHFDYRLAIESLKQGIDGIRINPGNIGSEKRINEIISWAKKTEKPIRIGVNSGSLEKDLLKKYGISSSAMIESALRYIRLFEKNDFDNMKLSLKSSSVPLTIECYRKIAKMVNYPLHLGITEAGTKFSGTIKSAIGIGTLLAEGIGDTIRVSLADDPVEEVKVGIEILKSIGLRKGLDIIACPTCGRTEVDVITISQKVEEKIKKLHIKENITVAIMGCTVNGPGEAREADVGIACGRNKILLFKKGKIIKQINKENIIHELILAIKMSIT